MAQLKISPEQQKGLISQISPSPAPASGYISPNITGEVIPPPEDPLVTAGREYRNLIQSKPPKVGASFLKSVMSSDIFRKLTLDQQVAFAKEYIHPSFTPETYNALRMDLGMPPFNLTGKPGGSVQEIPEPPSLLKLGVATIAPVAAGVLTSAGALSKGQNPKTAGAAGIAAGNLVDQAIRPVLGLPQREPTYTAQGLNALLGTSENNPATSFVGNSVQDELLGRAITGAATKAYGLAVAADKIGITPNISGRPFFESVNQGSLGLTKNIDLGRVNELATTTSGYLHGIAGSRAQKIESTFAPLARQQRAIEIAKNFEQELSDLANTQFGQANLNRFSLIASKVYESLPEDFRNIISANEFKAIAETTRLGEELKTSVPEIQIPQYKTIKSSLIGPGGIPLPSQQVQTGVVRIKGPVVPTAAKQFIDAHYDELRGLLNLPSERIPGNIGKAEDIFNYIATRGDSLNATNGKIPFADIWEWKKQLSSVAKEKGGLFTGLRNAVDDDIKDALVTFGKAPDGKTFSSKFSDINELVRRRYATFEPEGSPLSIMEKIKKYVKTPENPNETPTSLISQLVDEKLPAADLQRALNGGNIDYLTDPSIPTGMAVNAISNTRDGLATFKLSEMLRDSKVPLKDGSFQLDAKKFLESWDAIRTSEKGKLLFGPDAREGIDKLVNVLQGYQPRPESANGHLPTNFIQRYGGLGLYLAVGAIGAGAGSLSTSLIKGNQGMFLGGGGLMLSAWAISRLMLNKKTAPILAALVEGKTLPQSIETATRLVGLELRGMEVDAKLADGSILHGKFNAQGQFVSDSSTPLITNVGVNASTPVQPGILAGMNRLKQEYDANQQKVQENIPQSPTRIGARPTPIMAQ